MARRALTALIIIAISGYITLLPASVAAKGICGERNFQCGDGRCIPLTWACEGEADCLDGSDEAPAICNGKMKMSGIPIVTSTEASTIASDDVLPLAEPPVEIRAESKRDITEYEDESKMTKRLPIGGILETSDALRLVGMVRNLPLQFIDTSDRDSKTFSCSDDYDSAEHRTRCGKASNSNTTTALSKSGDDITVDDVLEEDEDFQSKPDLENRRRKQKPKRPTTGGPIRGTTSSCCKQVGGGDDELMLRRETARVNLDVLRRLSSMLNEEREKFAAERQMLGASRDMMMAETRRVNSERGKIDSERQKVDLERDLLQSQMLGRRSPRFNHIAEPL